MSKRDRAKAAGLLPENNVQVTDNKKETPSQTETTGQEKVAGSGEIGANTHKTDQRQDEKINEDEQTGGQAERRGQTPTRGTHEGQIIKSEAIMEAEDMMKKANEMMERAMDIIEGEQAKEEPELNDAKDVSGKQYTKEQLAKDSVPLPTLEEMKEEYLSRDGTMEVRTTLQRRHAEWLVATAHYNNTTVERQLDMIIRRAWQLDPYKAGKRNMGASVPAADKSIFGSPSD